MRFILVNQFFAPDPAPTGQLLADVARALAQAGHSVQVVCSDASYAASSNAGNHGLERVDIHRVGGARFGRSTAARLVSYSSFFLGALRYSLFGRRADVILTLTTPPLLSLIGTLAKFVRGSRHIIWEMDMYPDIAVALGVFAPRGIIDRMVGALADLSRHQADRIIALGPCMRDRLVGRGVSPEKVDVVQNWVDGNVIAPQPFPQPLPLVLLYSGNLGRAHDITTIAEAMPALSDPERFQFIFAGGGPGRIELETTCRSRQLGNAHFLNYQDHSTLADHLGSCHIGLVTQRPSTCGAVVPSKTYGLMAAGRPFLFIGPREATPALLIKSFRCGWHIEPGDSTGLTHLLELLAENPALIREAGDRARKAFVQNYDLPLGTAHILEILTGTERSAGLPRSLARHE